jgi:hypothetical protein
VDARPSPEQRELIDAADRLALKLGPGAVGDLDDHDRRAKLTAALEQTGWRELRTGSADEPLASGVEAAFVVHSLARRACDAAYLGPVLVHDLIRRAGGSPDGTARTIAVGSDLMTLAVSGSAGLAIDSAGSAGAVVLGANGLAEVALTGSDFTVDLTREVATIAASTATTALAGTRPVSTDSLEAWYALGVALTAADLVGAMEGALDLATEYAKERRQYGAPIGSYQAVQHLLAEAKTLTEGAYSAMIHAAWAVDALSPAEARAAAAVAKAYAARAARTVCETSIQVHGGIGNTWECMAHVFLRRTLLATDLFGGDGAQLALLASHRWGADK